MYGVKLDAGVARLLYHAGRVHHHLDLLAHVLRREDRVHLVRGAKVRVGAGAIGAGAVAPEACGDLDEHLGAVRLEAGEKSGGAYDERLAGRGRRHERGAEGAGRVDLVVRHEGAGLHEPRAALGTAHEVLDSLLAEGAVRREVRARGGGCHHEAVLDLDLADGKRAVEGFVAVLHDSS